MSNPEITFFTNRGCPYCHRVYITLNELGLPFKEVLIDLTKPREDWYLKINPVDSVKLVKDNMLTMVQRGKIPALKYSSDEIPEILLTDSSIIAQFLCDTRPSHLLPASLGNPSAPVTRARISLFIDTWISIGSFWIDIQLLDNEKKEAAVIAAIERVQERIEPLLENAEPFFGGSKEFTLAEVSLAPFVMRLYSLLENGYLPSALQKGLETLPRFSRWTKAIRSRKSVLYVWDKTEVIKRSQIHVQKLTTAAILIPTKA